MSTWQEHIKDVGKKNPDVMAGGGFKAILKLAGKTWKKGTGVIGSVAKTVVKGTRTVAKTGMNTLKMKKKHTKKARKGTKKRKGTRKGTRKGKKTRGKR